jgi:hypothetical protein
MTPMDPRTQWLLQVALAIIGLIRLLYKGSQRGWI